MNEDKQCPECLNAFEAIRELEKRVATLERGLMKLGFIAVTYPEGRPKQMYKSEGEVEDLEVIMEDKGASSTLSG